MRLQCKDLDTDEILYFLYVRRDEWCNNCFLDDRDIRLALFKGIPSNLFYAKMRQLFKNGFVQGCDCGCRGDYEITDKGISHLKRHETGDEGMGTYLDFLGNEIPYELPETIIKLKDETKRL